MSFFATTSNPRSVYSMDAHTSESGELKRKQNHFDDDCGIIMWANLISTNETKVILYVGTCSGSRYERGIYFSMSSELIFERRDVRGPLTHTFSKQLLGNNI